MCVRSFMCVTCKYVYESNATIMLINANQNANKLNK